MIKKSNNFNIRIFKRFLESQLFTILVLVE